MQATCPAATVIHPATDLPSVVCGVLALANDGAHVDGFEARGQVAAVFSGSKDPSTINLFCAGTGLPGSRCSYTACMIWRAGRDADWARRRGPDALRDADGYSAPNREGFADSDVRADFGGRDVVADYVAKTQEVAG